MEKNSKKNVIKNDFISNNSNLIKSVGIFAGGIAVGVLLIMTLTSTKIPTLKNGEELVASIKEVKISNDKLYERVKGLYSKNALLEIIDNAILEKKYPKNDQLDLEVKNQFDGIKAQYKENFQYLLTSNGYNTEDEFKSVLLLDIRRKKYVDDYCKGLVTDKELNDYYKDVVKHEIRASHILINPIFEEGVTAQTATDEQKTAANKKAEELAKEIIVKLNNGEKFADLAKEFSKDGSASNGGDLNFFRENLMVKEFEDAAYKLKINEYTKEPVKTQFGYHIILKTEEKEKMPLKDVEDEIKTKLGAEKLTNDSSLQHKALIKLRKDSELNIYDTDLKDEYNQYIKNVDEMKNDNN